MAIMKAIQKAFSKPEKVEQKTVKQQKIVYNPNANYVWKGNDIIPILGNDFQEAFNGAKLVYQAEKKGDVPAIDKHVALYALLQALERTFINAVETGIMQEQEPNPEE